MLPALRNASEVVRSWRRLCRAGGADTKNPAPAEGRRSRVEVSWEASAGLCQGVTLTRRRANLEVSVPRGTLRVIKSWVPWSLTVTPGEEEAVSLPTW